MRIRCQLLLALAVLGGSARGDEPADDAQARAAAARAARLDEALRTATAAIERDAKDARAYRSRASTYQALGRLDAALADLDRAVALLPDDPALLEERGSARFIAGQVEQAVADFDREVGLDPRRAPGHWKRGIAYYYVGRFDDGRRQFELHQTVNPNDVENAAWCYLCTARTRGAAAARASLLPIKQDERVPMMQLYELLANRGSVEGVWEAIRAGRPSEQEAKLREFYAHLYLGLYYEAAGNAELARQHIATAAHDYQNDHYMWHVARVHAERLGTGD